jgi:predicted acylesterase/phospholipase RssA
MNGGVSLAVWMGGVAFELDNLRRASAPDSPESDPTSTVPEPSDQPLEPAVAEQQLAALWRRLAADRQVQVTIDVIAGTSAGGLNGVLLAYAIANGVSLAPLKQVWLEVAQLSSTQLLKPATDDRPLSVLNGDVFLDRIAAAMRTLGAEPANRPSDVALTVTATALTGSSRVAADSYGNEFDEPDHRRRYDFRRVSNAFSLAAGDLAPTTRDDFVDIESLALAARATASFPVAFAPVRETPALRARRVLPSYPTEPDRDWLADGGILDNAPFDPVLRAIAAQPVDRPWRRTLCYIVPSIDEVRVGQALAPPSDLDAPWTAVLSAAIGLPREVDLRDDVEELHDLIRDGRSSDDVARFVSLLRPTAAAELTEGIALAKAGLPLYRQSRGAAAIYDISDAIATGQASAYLQSPTHITRGTLDLGGPHGWLPTDLPTELPTGSSWTWGLSATSRLITLLTRTLGADVDLAAGPPRVDPSVLGTLSTLSAQVSALRAAFDEACRSSAAPPPETAEGIVALADEIFAQLGLVERLGRIAHNAVAAFAGASADSLAALDVLDAALCVEVVNGAGGLAADASYHPIVDFVRMGLTPPPAVLGPVPAPNPGSPPIANLLYGTRLGHFGAFGLEEWRAWDWMWGRIHAAVHLARLFDLTPAELEQVIGLIVAAEGKTVAGLAAEIPVVMATAPGSLVERMESDGVDRPLTEVISALLTNPAPTDPPPPELLRTVAELLVPRTPEHLSTTHLLERLAATPGRWWAGRQVRKRVRKFEQEAPPGQPDPPK